MLMQGAAVVALSCSGYLAKNGRLGSALQAGVRCPVRLTRCFRILCASASMRTLAKHATAEGADHRARARVSSHTQAPGGDKALVGVSGACALLLGVRFAEYLVYETREDQFGKGPIARVVDFFGAFIGQEKKRKIVVNNWIDEYNALHKSDDASVRNSAYAQLVNSYYELATLFYEVGWGSSFHFSYRMMGESFSESIRRHEYYLASFLGGLKPGVCVC